MSFTHLTIIVVFAIIGLLAISVVVFANIRHNLKIILQIRENRKLIRQKHKDREEMVSRGENHDWVKIPHHTGSDLLVCRKTGWCPKYKTYYPKSHINMFLEGQRLEEKYEEYRKEKIGEMAKKYNLRFAQIEDMSDEFFSMKKDFYVENIK